VQLGFEHSERIAQACDGVVVLVAVELHRTQSGRDGTRHVRLACAGMRAFPQQSL
jgi:hypothetical protein